MKYKLQIIGIILGSSLTLPVFAETLITQGYDGDITSTTAGTWYQVFENTGSQNISIDSLDFQAQFNSWPGNGELSFTICRQYDGGDRCIGSITSTSSQNNIFPFDDALIGVWTEYHVDFATPAVIAPAEATTTSYVLRIQINTNDSYVKGSTNSDSYAGGYLYQNDAVPPVANFNVKDLYFKLNSTSTPASSLELISPVNQNANNPVKITGTYTLPETMGAYNLNFEFWPYTDNTYATLKYPLPTWFSIIATNTAENAGFDGEVILPYAGYYKYFGYINGIAGGAFYTSTNTLPVNFYLDQVGSASSSPYQFISGSLINYVREFAGISLEDLGLATRTCDSLITDFSDCVWNASVGIMEALFVTNNVSVDLFANGFSKLQTIFPFNIFFDFSTVVKRNLGNQASLTTTLPQLGGFTPAVSVISENLISDFVGSQVRDDWFDLLENAIWITLGLGIFSMLL